MKLKTKLILMVLGVTLMLSVVFGIAQRWTMNSARTMATEAVKGRALANVGTLAETLNFDLALASGDDTRQSASDKVKAFIDSHRETESLVVLDARQELFVRAGRGRTPDEILTRFQDATKRGAAADQETVYAVTPVLDEAGKRVGTVAYTESLSRLNEQERRSLDISLMFGLLALLLAAGAAWAIGHRMVAPLASLASTAERIAGGELGELRLPAGATGEVQALSASVARMADALRGQVGAFQRLAQEVSGVSQEVAGAMTQLSTAATEQAAAVAETAATVEEMEKSAHSAAGNAHKIVESADRTTEASVRGRKAVESTNAIIMAIKDDSQIVSAKSKALIAALEEVGAILATVNAIAEQSKILAVNASIEAAKAGEFGSGFAVVAQEVKDLAQQSKEATLQITKTLSGIRHAIDDMVNAAANGQRRTEEGVKMVGNAGAIVNDLSEAIQESSKLANVIAASIQQQTIGLSQIATSIDQIKSTALENQDVSQDIHRATGELTESTNRLVEVVGAWKLST